jgi:diguanylate cyclase (GGDEF)-like protein
VTETSLLDSVNLNAIDEALASGLRLLTFPPGLEATFERETGAQRCRQLIGRAFIGILVYDLFLIADWLATPELFTIAMWVRLGFFTPLALLLTFLLYRSPSAFFRESIMCIGGGLLSTATIFYLMSASGGHPQPTLHESIILVVLFLTVVQRIRFWYLLPTCLSFLVLHALALATFYQYPLGQQVATNMVFSAALVFALVASYTLERDLRQNYLLSLRGRLQNNELDLMSRRDPLTGLGNRRSLEEAIADCEQNNASRAESLAVVLLDIDHFKMFNDTAGHQAGDICLKRIASIIRSQLRERTDDAFRFGGEEFLVALRMTDLQSGIGIAERMRRAIEDAAIPHPALPSGSIVTASFGVACATIGHDMRAAEIIASADAALYAAKRNGRNQVWPRFLSALGTTPAAEVTELRDWRSQAG